MSIKQKLQVQKQKQICLLNKFFTLVFRRTFSFISITFTIEIAFFMDWNLQVLANEPSPKLHLRTFLIGDSKKEKEEEIRAATFNQLGGKRKSYFLKLGVMTHFRGQFSCANTKTHFTRETMVRKSQIYSSQYPPTLSVYDIQLNVMQSMSLSYHLSHQCLHVRAVLSYSTRKVFQKVPMSQRS